MVIHKNKNKINKSIKQSSNQAVKKKSGYHALHCMGLGLSAAEFYRGMPGTFERRSRSVLARTNAIITETLRVKQRMGLYCMERTYRRSDHNITVIRYLSIIIDDIKTSDNRCLSTRKKMKERCGNSAVDTRKKSTRHFNKHFRQHRVQTLHECGIISVFGVTGESAYHVKQRGRWSHAQKVLSTAALSY